MPTIPPIYIDSIQMRRCRTPGAVRVVEGCRVPWGKVNGRDVALIRAQDLPVRTSTTEIPTERRANLEPWIAAKLDPLLRLSDEPEQIIVSVRELDGRLPRDHQPMQQVMQCVACSKTTCSPHQRFRSKTNFTRRSSSSRSRSQ